MLKKYILSDLQNSTLLLKYYIKLIHQYTQQYKYYKLTKIKIMHKHTYTYPLF